MRRTKGWVSLVLALMLVTVFSLAGCTKNGSPTVSAGTPTSSKSEVATPTVQPTKDASKDLKFVKLKMYYPCGGCGGKGDSAVQDAVNKYLQEKLNANLELNGVGWSGWGQKMPLIYQSGEQADIVWTSGGDYYSSVAKKAFQPLDALIDQYGMELKKTIEPEFLEGPKVGGKLYAIPTNKEKVTQDAAFLRKDLVDKYKIDVPKIKNLPDFATAFEATKGETGIKTAYNPQDFFGNATSGFENPDIEPVNSVHNPMYGAFNTKTGEVLNFFTLPQTVKQYEVVRDWFNKGYSNKDASTNPTDSWNATKNGKAWIVFGSAKPGSEIDVSQNVGHEMVKASFGSPIISSDTLTNSMLAIPTTSADAARAMMVINLLHTDPYLENLIVYGIEGKQYVKVSNNIIKLPDGIKSAADSGYAPGINWEIGNQFIQYLYDNQDPNQWENFKKWGQQGKKAFLLGFTFDPSKVKNEISALDGVKNIYWPLLTTGSVDTKETFDKFKAELENKHIDVLLKEVKRQIDEWMKVNNKVLLK